MIKTNSTLTKLIPALAGVSYFFNAHGAFQKVLLLFITLILYSFSSLAFSITVIDDSGQVISLQKPASRIISLAPHITELLFHIEQGNKVVGVDQSSDFPEAAQRIPKIGNSNQINIESILALKPDLVIAWYSGNSNKQLAHLKEFNIPVFYSEPRSLVDIKDSILKFGQLTNSETIAGQKALDFEKEIITFKNASKLNQEKKVNVFYQVWGNPLITLNGDHIVTEVISLCGGNNIFSDLRVLAPQVSIEAVIQANPDLIITGDKNTEEINSWRKWNTMSAVQNNQFLSVNSDHLVRAGPRILLGVEVICTKLSKLKNKR